MSAMLNNAAKVSDAHSFRLWRVFPDVPLIVDTAVSLQKNFDGAK
jgi:hypothetical protein